MYSELVTQKRNHQLLDNQIILLYLENDQFADFQISILAYFFRNADIAREKVQTFIKALPESINKNAMSIYDMHIEEGIAKGREEGQKEMRLKLTRQMLLKGLDYNFIIDILHVEPEFIDTVREALLLEQEGLSSEATADNVPTPPVP